MEADFWLQRWHEGRIGFHRDTVMPLLEKHWGALALPAGSRVLVPLAGKSLDMIWLTTRGYRVLGVELSPLAVEQFFKENALTPVVHESKYGVQHVAGGIQMILGDAFGLDVQALADCGGVYDRAALIALPQEMRVRYVDELYARLPTGCRGLLITLEYPQQEKVGPPFSVEEAEVRRLYGTHWTIDLLERQDILAQNPDFEVSALSTAVYRLQRRNQAKIT
ncbi:MAG: thiopurine S-methyltransferase [Rhodanobacter sp.]|jgi:thiopurine S-methyltransferase|nr:thiopurine S-methyltransferase [Rhodanobacter sp.]